MYLMRLFILFCCQCSRLEFLGAVRFQNQMFGTCRNFLSSADRDVDLDTFLNWISIPEWFFSLHQRCSCCLEFHLVLQVDCWCKLAEIPGESSPTWLWLQLRFCSYLQACQLHWGTSIFWILRQGYFSSQMCETKTHHHADLCTRQPSNDCLPSWP